MVVFDAHSLEHNQLANAKLIDIFPKLKIFSSDFNLHSPQQNPTSKEISTTSIIHRNIDVLLTGSYQTSTTLLSKAVSTNPKDYVSVFLLTRLSIPNKEIPKKPNKHKQRIKPKEVTELITNITP